MKSPDLGLWKIVIVGASAGVGRAIAEELGAKGASLVLASRGKRDLEAVASNLRARWGSQVFTFSLDMADEDLDVASFRVECQSSLGGIDALILTAALIHPDDAGPADHAVSASMMRANYYSSVRLVSEFAKEFESQGTGNITAFSSIAAAAPRGRNTLYSSTKAGLTAFCQGLRHHFAWSDVHVNIIAMGYANTSMSFGKKLLFPVASPRDVAQFTVRNLDRDIGLVYYPRFWRFVVSVLRTLPWFLFRRLQF